MRQLESGVTLASGSRSHEACPEGVLGGRAGFFSNQQDTLGCVGHPRPHGTPTGTRESCRAQRHRSHRVPRGASDSRAGEEARAPGCRLRLRPGAGSQLLPSFGGFGMARGPGAPRGPLLPLSVPAAQSRSLVPSSPAPSLGVSSFFFNQFPKKMMYVEGVKIEFIYDKSKLWPKKTQKTKTPEEATGFWRVPGAASGVSARPAGCPCPPGPRRPLLHRPFSEAGKPTTPSEGLHGATWKLCT